MKNNWIYWIIGIIVLLAVVFLLPKTELFALFGTSYGPDNVGVSLLSESQYGYTYLYTFSPGDPSPYYWNTGNSFSFSIPTLGKPESIPSNAILATQYLTKDVTYSLSASVSSGNPASASFTWKERYAKCGINVGNSQTGAAPGIFCTFYGSVNENVNLYGLTQTQATVYIPKIGYNCLNDYMCNTGYICQLGQCVIQQCNTLADTNCDNKVDRTELGNYISKWIAGTATRENLGNAIQAWVAG